MGPAARMWPLPPPPLDRPLVHDRDGVREWVAGPDPDRRQASFLSPRQECRGFFYAHLIRHEDCDGNPASGEPDSQPRGRGQQRLPPQGAPR